MNYQTLKNYTFGEIKEFLLYLEPVTPFDNGVFFTFDSEEEILKVIKNELLNFCDVGEAEIEEAQASLEEILPDSIEKIDETKLSKINQLISAWKVGYVGTLDNIMISTGQAENWFRLQFRNHFELDGKDTPIQPKEIEDFKLFLLPEWMR